MSLSSFHFITWLIFYCLYNSYLSTSWLLCYFIVGITLTFFNFMVGVVLYCWYYSYIFPLHGCHGIVLLVLLLHLSTLWLVWYSFFKLCVSFISPPPPYDIVTMLLFALISVTLSIPVYGWLAHDRCYRWYTFKDQPIYDMC